MLQLHSASLLSRVGRAQTTALDRQFAELGVTTQQAALLIHASPEPVMPSNLTEALGTDTAGMTRLVDRLEAKGLVHRRRRLDDRRAVVIELTGDGRMLLPRLAPVFGRVTAQLFDGFSTEDVEHLLSMCKRMLANLDLTASGGGSS
jgi:DNA-binding MarR family transcriptional regulator